MSFALTEELKAWVESRVASGEYGNASEYLRELLRRDREEQACRQLRELLRQGLASGPAVPVDAAQLERWQLRLHAVEDRSPVAGRDPDPSAR